MAALTVVDGNIKNSKSCSTEAPTIQIPNVRRRTSSRVRRRFRTAARMSCPTWVGGSEYGDYEYPYYVSGPYAEMEGEEEGGPSIPLKPVMVGVCAMKTKVWRP